MNKKELTKAVAEATGFTQVKSKKAIEAFMTAVNTALADGNGVKLSKFGTFRLVDLKERNGVNPKTGAPLLIPAKTVVRFRAANETKQVVNS